MDDDNFIRLLTETSTLKYHIIYDKYYFNHTSQTLIALKLIGGSDEDFAKFLDWYTRDLYKSNGYRTSEEVNFFNDLDEQEVSIKVKSIRGKRIFFYTLVSHFEKLLKSKYQENLSDLVAGEYVQTNLYFGLLGSAFHSLLHVGYGLAFDHPRIVCEGLAYAVCAYFGINEDKDIDGVGRGQKDLYSVLKMLKSDHQMNGYIHEQSNAQHGSIINNGRLATFLNVLYKLREDDLIKYATEVHLQLPEQNNEPCLTSFLNSLIEASTMLYIRSKNINDFFLLHGITSSWALKQVILRVHRNISLCKVHSMAKVFICSLLAVYLARGAPELNEISEVQKIVQIKCRSWNEIMKDTLTGKRDEHVYKLVMTCWNTATSIESNQENNDRMEMYKLACEIALKYELLV